MSRYLFECPGRPPAPDLRVGAHHGPVEAVGARPGVGHLPDVLFVVKDLLFPAARPVLDVGKAAHPAAYLKLGLLVVDLKGDRSVCARVCVHGGGGGGVTQYSAPTLGSAGYVQHKLAEGHQTYSAVVVLAGWVSLLDFTQQQ